ncbi:MAG TPA: DNA polymerase Y family protein [Dehalococcoidia bacterium]|nr:DNA polymerase Y family protein [Dehalococcoidia bacterium]
MLTCIAIPRFSVEVERQRRQSSATSLILIGEATVFDCSLGAEASGVRRGMRMSEAIGLCHRAEVLPPDLSYYQCRFEEVMNFLEGFSPELEPAGLGLAYLSLKGLAAEPQELADRLISGLHKRFGLMATAGIAKGKFTARVAAQTSRPGLAKLVQAGQDAGFLAPLPVDLLPIDEPVRWRLELLGLRTLGEIATLPLGAYQQQFGTEGKRCWELAQGIDSEPLLPRLQEESIVRRLQLPAAAVSIDPILAGLERLLYSAYGSPDRRGRWVRKVVARGLLDGGGSWELPVSFREALSDPAHAWFAVKSAIVRHPPQRPVEELEVELVGLSAESGRQAGMFESKGKLWRQIDETVRQLHAKQGYVPLGKIVEVEPWSRIPERRAALVEFEP